MRPSGTPSTRGRVAWYRFRQLASSPARDANGNTLAVWSRRRSSAARSSHSFAGSPSFWYFFWSRSSISFSMASLVSDRKIGESDSAIKGNPPLPPSVGEVRPGSRRNDSTATSRNEADARRAAVNRLRVGFRVAFRTASGVRARTADARPFKPRPETGQSGRQAEVRATKKRPGLRLAGRHGRGRGDQADRRHGRDDGDPRAPPRPLGQPALVAAFALQRGWTARSDSAPGPPTRRPKGSSEPSPRIESQGSSPRRAAGGRSRRPGSASGQACTGERPRTRPGHEPDYTPDGRDDQSFQDEQPPDDPERVARGPQEAQFAGPPLQVEPEQQADEHEGGNDQEEAEREEQQAKVRAPAAGLAHPLGHVVEREPAAFRDEVPPEGFPARGAGRRSRPPIGANRTDVVSPNRVPHRRRAVARVTYAFGVVRYRCECCRPAA